MAIIRRIEISNFRAIKNLAWNPSHGVNCLIGRGDSGKSTVLDAIDLCIGARRFFQFSDTDFHNLDTTQPIRVEVTLGALVGAMRTLEGYGPFLRGFDSKLGMLTDEPVQGAEVVLTVGLSVTPDLEPTWSLISDRASRQGLTRNLAWKDRVALSPTKIGAVADFNLSWQRGSVLNRLTDERPDITAGLLDAARNARSFFGDRAQGNLATSLEQVQLTATELGVDIGGRARALLDAHSISFGTGAVSLHDAGGVPMKALGVGSTRMIIAGLQRRAGAASPVILVDELEYGLEPHRIIRFLWSLGAKDEQPTQQAFATTHSPVAVRELAGRQLCVVRENGGTHQVLPLGDSDETQSTLRCYPDAFLATSVIVCEGASEVGFLRGLDLDRIGRGLPSLTSMATALVDCGGGGPNRPYERAAVFQRLGYRTLVLRDSDQLPATEIEQAFIENGGKVVCWRLGRAIEDELFACLPSDSCLQLIRYAYDLHGDLVHQHVSSASNNQMTLEGIWAESNAGGLSASTRTVLGAASRTRKAGWFKSVTWMEAAATTIVGPSMGHADRDFVALAQSIFDWVANA